MSTVNWTPKFKNSDGTEELLVLGVDQVASSDGTSLTDFIASAGESNDLTYTELIDVIEGESLTISPMVQSAIDEVQGNVDAEIANREAAISDVKDDFQNYLPLTGGTLSGDTIGLLNDLVKMIANSQGLSVQVFTEATKNRRILAVYNDATKANLSEALQMLTYDVASNKWNEYKLYGEHNPPPSYELIGSAIGTNSVTIDASKYSEYCVIQRNSAMNLVHTYISDAQTTENDTYEGTYYSATAYKFGSVKWTPTSVRTIGVLSNGSDITSSTTLLVYGRRK